MFAILILNYKIKIMKKKVLGFISVISVVAFSIVGTNFFVTNNVKDFKFSVQNATAIASGEDGPGNYKGAINTYCKDPKGEKGCKSDSDPKKTCSYSIYCIK